MELGANVLQWIALGFMHLFQSSPSHEFLSSSDNWHLKWGPETLHTVRFFKVV